MSLDEDIIGPVLRSMVVAMRPFDELVARLYAAGLRQSSCTSGLARSKGKYLAGWALDVGGLVLLNQSRGIPGGAPVGYVTLTTYLFDIVHNYRGLLNKQKQITDSAIAADYWLNCYDDVGRKLVRFPVFAAGLYFLAESGFDIARNFITGAPLQGDTGSNLQFGLSLLSLATSMYLKGTDPKLLDKGPVWIAAYRHAAAMAQKLKGALPGRVPVPLPSPLPAPVPAAINLQHSIDFYV